MGSKWLGSHMGPRALSPQGPPLCSPGLDTVNPFEPCVLWSSSWSKAGPHTGRVAPAWPREALGGSCGQASGGQGPGSCVHTGIVAVLAEVSRFLLSSQAVGIGTQRGHGSENLTAVGTRRAWC